ncbi:MAG TPA: hypothetical protein VF392_07035 [Terracidiphilus sp.]
MDSIRVQPSTVRFARLWQRRVPPRTIACLCSVLLLLVGPLNPQQNPQPNVERHSILDPVLTASPDANAQMRMRQAQAKKQDFEAANAERKKQLTDDSAHLLALATELKAEVDKTNKDTLSLNVIRKASEIERLAHDVREKMRLVVGQS